MWRSVQRLDIFLQCQQTRIDPSANVSGATRSVATSRTQRPSIQRVRTTGSSSPSSTCAVTDHSSLVGTRWTLTRRRLSSALVCRDSKFAKISPRCSGVRFTPLTKKTHLDVWVPRGARHARADPPRRAARAPSARLFSRARARAATATSTAAPAASYSGRWPAASAASPPCRRRRASLRSPRASPARSVSFSSTMLGQHRARLSHLASGSWVAQSR